MIYTVLVYVKNLAVSFLVPIILLHLHRVYVNGKSYVANSPVFVTGTKKLLVYKGKEPFEFSYADMKSSFWLEEEDLQPKL